MVGGGSPGYLDESRGEQVMTHTFTLSGLGESPFQVCSPADPAAVANTAFFCEHCGRMLRNRYFVKSADGRVSVVGVDCVQRTGDAGLIAGVKRLQKRQRDEAREASRQQLQQARRAEERSMFGGKTLQELIDELDEKGRAIKQAARDEVVDLPVAITLMRSNGTFGNNMVERACELESFSDGMISAMRDIVARELSKGARRNSKAYEQAKSAAEASTQTLEAVVQRHCAAHMEVLDEIAGLHRQRKRSACAY